MGPNWGMPHTPACTSLMASWISWLAIHQRSIPSNEYWYKTFLWQWTWLPFFWFRFIERDYQKAYRARESPKRGFASLLRALRLFQRYKPLWALTDKVYVRWVSNLLPAITIWDTFLLGQTDRLPESAMHNQCFKARRTWNILTSSNCRSSCSGLFMIGDLFRLSHAIFSMWLFNYQLGATANS